MMLPSGGTAAGWTGKLWALQQGIDGAADVCRRTYFWFTDADIVHAPDTLRRLVARAESQRLDLASLMVLLQAKTIPERLLIPAFLYFFLMLYPPKWIADRQIENGRGRGRLHLAAESGSGTNWGNFGDSRRGDRRLRIGTGSEAQRRKHLDGVDAEKREPARRIRTLGRYAT